MHIATGKLFFCVRTYTIYLTPLARVRKKAEPKAVSPIMNANKIHTSIFLLLVNFYNTFSLLKIPD